MLLIMKIVMVLSIQSKGRKRGQEETSFFERLARCLPWRQRDTADLLGQGLKLQIGNVTECALLGLLEELSKT